MASRIVLCPVDFSPLSHRSLRLAVEVCRRLDAHLVLHHNLDVRPPNYLAVTWMWSEDHEAAEERKAAKVRELLQELFDEIPDGISYEAKLTRGPLDEVLLYLAGELPADLIVMGTHGRTDSEHTSLTERIIIQAPCTVLTTGEAYDPESVFAASAGVGPEALSILLPVDFSPRSRMALEFAFALAQAMPHHLHLVHVLRPAYKPADPAALRPELERIEQQLAALAPAGLAGRVSVEAVVGDPVEGILASARRNSALFILMAAHGKSLLRRFLFGTTTHGVLHGSGCPVWFVPWRARRQLAAPVAGSEERGVGSAAAT